MNDKTNVITFEFTQNPLFNKTKTIQTPKIIFFFILRHNQPQTLKYTKVETLKHQSFVS